MTGPLQDVYDAVIYPAFRLAGIIGAPQRGTGKSDLVDALAILNTLLDEWATQRLLVYHVVRSVQKMVAGKQNYEIGDTGDWQVTRPVRIEMAGYIQILSASEPPTELPLAILTPQDWASIAVKTITSSTPQKLYYEPTVPNGTAWLWPVPQIANQIALYLWQQLGQFQTIEDPVVLPPGYQKALQYNLAREFSMRPWHASTLGMSPLALEEAERSKHWVKAMNRPTMDFQMRCEGAVLGVEAKGRWDITTNQMRWS